METIDLALFTQFPVGVSSEGPEGGRVLATSPSLTQHLLSLSPPGAPAVCSQSRPTASPPERICFSRASFLDDRPDGGVSDFVLFQKAPCFFSRPPGRELKGKVWTTTQLCYVARGVDRMILSKEACRDLGLGVPPL